MCHSRHVSLLLESGCNAVVLPLAGVESDGGLSIAKFLNLIVEHGLGRTVQARVHPAMANSMLEWAQDMLVLIHDL